MTGGGWPLLVGLVELLLQPSSCAQLRSFGVSTRMHAYIYIYILG